MDMNGKEVKKEIVDHAANLFQGTVSLTGVEKYEVYIHDHRSFTVKCWGNNGMPRYFEVSVAERI